MYCKILSPEKIFFDGNIKQISLPTEQGEITILPKHNPLVTILKPGIIKILPEYNEKDTNFEYNQFLFENEKILISVAKGTIFVDGYNVMVLTSVATASPEESEEKLKEMKVDLEKKIKELSKTGSIEDIERFTVTIEKINADMRLLKIGQLKKN